MNSLLDPTLQTPLLLGALLCLGLWITFFKAAGSGWRFELFAVDFSLGAFLCALAAALALGNFGTDLPFNDRLMVASKTAQGMAFVAGCIFAVGNTLLLGACSLLGVANGFVIAGSLALLTNALLNTSSGNTVMLLVSALLLLIAAGLGAVAANAREGKTVASAAPRYPPGQQTARLRKSTKGILVAGLGGVALGLFLPLADRGAYDEFGLGPYAGLFLFCLGLLVSSLVFSLYFFNIALEGGALPLRSYLGGWPVRHLAGLGAGVVWAIGALAVALLKTPNGAQGAVRRAAMPLSTLLPLAMIVAPVVLGVVVWREYSRVPRVASILLMAACLFLAAGLWAFALGQPATALP